MLDMIEMCHCGKPLHYSDSMAEAMVRQLIDDLGPDVKVTVGARTFLVQRHFIALHGLSAEEVPHLGFKEVVR